MLAKVKEVFQKKKTGMIVEGAITLGGLIGLLVVKAVSDKLASKIVKDSTETPAAGDNAGSKAQYLGREKGIIEIWCLSLFLMILILIKNSFDNLSIFCR